MDGSGQVDSPEPTMHFEAGEALSAGLASGARLALTGLNVVDVQSRRVIEKTSVVISDGRIVEVGAASVDDLPTIELDGCWASPSLVDMHVHVTFEARAHDGLVSFSPDEPPQLGMARAVQNLTEALRNGIALVRDLGGREAQLAQIKNLLRSGSLLLPELVTAGEPLCVPGGHGSSFGQHLNAGETIDELLQRHVSRGHEWLKVMNGPELWEHEQLVSIVRAARRVGLSTAVHAFTPDGIRSAVRAGVDTIEHGLVNDGDLLVEARRHDIHFVPTAYCSWISLRPRFTRTQKHSELQHLEYWYQYLEECRPMHLGGRLPILPGTDAGCAPCSFDDYLEELLYFERWGLSSMDILRIATLDAARRLKRSRDFGSIEAGKWANMLITEHDPTMTVGHLRHPLLVLFKGAGVRNALGERWP